MFFLNAASFGKNAADFYDLKQILSNDTFKNNFEPFNGEKKIWKNIKFQTLMISNS